jgi:hypothetical protein
MEHEAPSLSLTWRIRANHWRQLAKWKNKMATDKELAEFINNHKSQLLSCGIPKLYWNTLCEKLKQEVNRFSAF